MKLIPDTHWLGRSARRGKTISGWFRKPWIGWAGIICVSFLAMWRIWEKLDLTFGDTAVYFSRGAGWKERGSLEKVDEMVFSPLYAVYYGEVQRAFSDPYAATIVHRMLIMIAASVCVLGVMRNVIPKSLAWWIAAWWAVLPINWAGVYEVHFFNFVFLALSCWLAGAGRSLWWRSAALAALFCSALLIRNEFLLAYGLLALGIVSYEFVQAKRSALPVRQLVLNGLRLAAPSAAVIIGAVILFSGNPRVLRWRAIKEQFQKRQESNMVQVYAFSYQQRHPEWTRNPWLEGGDLMIQEFKSAKPAWGEALRENPKAFFSHVWWNLSLVPAGLELGLFNAYYGRFTPDFFQHPHASCGPLLGLGALFFICIWAFILVCRGRAAWFTRNRRGMWSWAVLLCCLPSSFIAIVTQRPRPSYILMLLLGCMALSGVSAAIVWRSFARPWRRIGAAVAHAVWCCLALFFLLEGPQFGPRKLLEDYRRIAPYAGSLRNKNRTFCAATLQPVELCCYLGGPSWSRPHALSFSSISDALKAGTSMEEAIRQLRITDLYMKGGSLENQMVKDWEVHAAETGWHLLAESAVPSEAWKLYSRPIPSSGELQ